MSDPSRDLELAALVRLGLASRIDSAALEDRSGPLIEALVRTGTLRAHQAAAVRAYVARNEVVCACGERSLAPEEAKAFACTRCGSALGRGSSGGTWSPRGRAARAPGVGSRVGPLELLEVLGQGASGTVYRARHVGLGRLSAVKVLPLAALDAKKKTRFEREVEALGRLDHSGIVKIHASFELSDSLACEMDLVEGETLEALVDRRGPLPWREAADLLARIADAVDHAHRAGVVHRDLKPANVLVRREDGAPLVADFGLARLTDQSSSLTRVGAFVGTPVYMAPEAFAGSSAPSCDIYGLGAILYQLLAGKGPFEEVQPEALFYKVSRGICEPLDPSRVPADLERVRARAMAPDPNGRYATPGELAHDLRRVLAGERVAGPRSRVRWLVAFLCALGALGAAVALRGAPSDRGSDAPAPLAAGSLSLADAVALLASGGPDVARLAAAEAVIARAGAPGLAAVDSGIALVPSSTALRRLRLAARRRLGAALDAGDLAAGDDSGTELESLVAYALRHGLDGDAAVPRLRALVASHPGASSLSTLLGVVACRSGDLSLHDEALRALRAGRPSPGDRGAGSPPILDELAVRLARALSEADAFTRIIDDSDRRSPSEIGAVATRLKRELESLATIAPETVPVVLAPIGPAARSALADRRLADITHSELPFALMDVLEPARSTLPPALIALYALLGDIGTVSNQKHAPVDPDILARAARSLVDTDPLLAASGLELAASNQVEAGHLDDPEALEAIYDLAVHEIAAASSGPKPPTEFEEFWLGNMRRRSATGRCVLEETLGKRSTSPEAARARFEKALVFAREGLETTQRYDGTPNLIAQSAERIVRLLFRLDRAAECEELYPVLPQADALRAELLRRGGDPRGAIELARKSLAGSTTPNADAHAVIALAEADLGDLDAARAELTKLMEAQKWTYAVLEEWHSDAVGAAIARKSAHR